MLPLAAHSLAGFSKQTLPTFDHERSRIGNPVATPPHRPDQRLLFDVKPNRTRTHPDLHQHIIIGLQ
jgi:hypothetical protein